MDYQCQRRTTFDAIECARRSTFFPHLKIKFKLSFQTEHSNYLLINQDSSSTHEFVENLPPSNFTIRAALDARISVSRADVRNKLEEAIGERLRLDERWRVTKRAWRELWRILPRKRLPLFTVLDLHFKIRLTHSHVHAGEVRRCSICLEELHGAASATKMPCSHLFHGRCIDQWLRTSHFCPLCRYEMPTTDH